MYFRVSLLFNFYVPNRLSHPYHLVEFSFMFGTSGLIIHFYFIFDEIHGSKQNSPRWGAICGVTPGAILFVYAQ